ncbi:putative 16S rRNA (guanine1516-N2)-methyltransferase [Magnetofaba australis IT-1]|uniref:Ribosomal RNA small subunit methyltransferase J n=2 Tax=Magnetofaba TaxID=1472292 RepID=A0A1Y2K6F5_9PROT|nr:putative 16S rRNA (guanine1516-N2)-methyltransferase [Magnetofaba australis IT-1]
MSHLLVVTAERLELRALTDPTGGGPVFAEFSGGAAENWERGQPLAKAVGVKGGVTPSILDATAGLGGDAWILARLGCAVTLIERSPIIAALLEDALQRAQRDDEAAPLATRMRLLAGDARELMAQWSDEPPDVITLDPMFPEKKKGALPNKEMRRLKQLVGDDADAAETLAGALQLAGKRVVVKRPLKAPPLDGPKPGHAISGRSTRFDVYHVANSKQVNS